MAKLRPTLIMIRLIVRVNQPSSPPSQPSPSEGLYPVRSARYDGDVHTYPLYEVVSALDFYTADMSAATCSRLTYWTAISHPVVSLSF